MGHRRPILARGSVKIDATHCQIRTCISRTKFRDAHRNDSFRGEIAFHDRAKRRPNNVVIFALRNSFPSVGTLVAIYGRISSPFRLFCLPRYLRKIESFRFQLSIASKFEFRSAGAPSATSSFTVGMIARSGRDEEDRNSTSGN